MLVPAINYSCQLTEKFNEIWFDDKYKYFNFASYYDSFKVDDSSWNKHQFVSIDNNGNIIGYIGYNVDRQTYSCNGLGIVNFTDNKIIFGKDLRQALVDIFEKYKFRKLNFSVLIGNPIEKTYDKLIEKYNGRIVGIYFEDIKLMDGEFYNKKSYEIFRDDYLRAKKERGE